ncbi:MAG TPA: tRNA pseudouridine(38-40) synthase TruA [Steroidobacteraceae bacterium]|nr:tRNA pseudouridine(38-40) synthase TruA [Steroidobacteraceae bacterium]
MTRIAVGLEYDGTLYAGWQSQPTADTVQVLSERALGKVAAEPVSLVCAGRTDAGVHARGQVAHFDTAAARSMRAWTLGANSELPRDISISWVRPVPEHFHARYSAEARTYRYLIFNRASRSGLLARRATWVHRPLDAERMQQASAALLGEHDFSAFRAAECQAKSPVRRLQRLSVSRTGDWLTIEATANAFLHHMVRNIAGLLIKIGKGDAPASWAAEVLAGRERRLGAPTAPAQGLYLWSVRYPAAFALPGAPGPEDAIIGAGFPP